MKRISIFTVVVLLVLSGVVWTWTNSGSVEDELIKLEKKWGDAILKGDLEVVAKLLADDYINTDFEGTVWTKAKELEALKSSDWEITSMETDDWNVRVYGDAAVVMARNTAKGKFKGEEISGQFRFTDTWIKKDGRWQCVAAHNSVVK